MYYDYSFWRLTLNFETQAWKKHFARGVYMLYYIKIEREDRSIRFDLIKKQHICYAQSSCNIVTFA